MRRFVLHPAAWCALLLGANGIKPKPPTLPDRPSRPTAPPSSTDEQGVLL